MTHTRRQSIGYAYEYELVKRFVKTGFARRMGGSSTGFPDILFTTHDNENEIFACEAKATTQATILYIPQDEIQRCFNILEMFKAYDYRWVLFAFKFHGSKRARREIREYIFKTDFDSENDFKKVKWIRCNYEGILKNDSNNTLDLCDF